MRETLLEARDLVKHFTVRGTTFRSGGDVVHAVDWASLEEGEANRLRHFGFDEGVAVEPLHLRPFGRDPLAVRLGRMTVAIRRSPSRAIRVPPLAA